ncbi:hypothetical protein PoB_005813200 [Plakobranchus ocellatus]|uniref:Uncharacterized protein n=1 Tax=Plakobranchus ocellatus TaxID=259542 RepID=A0AAV4CJE0_9GAST|nr:hypothetical protein PoB_005813200 [Plakobranchus ocellatus]
MFDCRILTAISEMLAVEFGGEGGAGELARHWAGTWMEVWNGQRTVDNFLLIVPILKSLTWAFQKGVFGEIRGAKTN